MRLIDAAHVRYALAAVLLCPAGAARADEHAIGTLRIDGVRMEIDERTEPGPTEAVVAAVAIRWRTEHPREPVVESTVGGWRVLGQRVGTRYRTMQARALGSSATQVVTAWRDLRSTTPEPPMPVALPRAARVQRTLQTDEAGRRVLQVYATVAAAPGLVARQLAAAASRAGWQPSSRTVDVVSLVSAWHRGADDLLVVVGTEDGVTTVLLHATRRPDPADGTQR